MEGFFIIEVVSDLCTVFNTPIFLQSKQKSCIHSFSSMNRDKRHFVHEYCEHFGCQSESYDEEPNKNVVATAVRGVVSIQNVIC